MATKKPTGEPVTHSNVNNNTNHVHVNVHMPENKKPRAPRKAPVKKSKPNWIVKATVVAIISAIISFLAYQFTKEANGGERPKPGSLGPVIRDNN